MQNSFINTMLKTRNNTSADKYFAYIVLSNGLSELQRVKEEKQYVLLYVERLLIKYIYIYIYVY